MKTTAIILGASGHVGQNLTHYMEGSVDEILPYSRKEGHIPIHLFAPSSPDVSMLINCIGVGTPQKETSIGNAILDLENEWDDKCLAYLETHPDTTYFYFSSGVADERFNEHTDYAEAKKAIEAKHQKYPYRIFDLRLFSFFSRFIDLDNGQFMPSVIKALLNKSHLIVSPNEIKRDYIHPCDLTSYILAVYNSNSIGGMGEVGSSEPVTKSEILEWFAKHGGLMYETPPDGKIERKPDYIPFRPFSGFASSMDTIIHESARILGEI